jgi:SET domain-containing protein
MRATRLRAVTDESGVGVAGSPIHGRGVYALEAIDPGETIEVCPVLLIPAAEIRHLRKTMLADYYFRWGSDAAIALGFGSLYNHSYQPNATFELDFDADVIKFIAWLYIASGEEITVNYNGSPDDSGSVWFVDNGPPPIGPG